MQFSLILGVTLKGLGAVPDQRSLVDGYTSKGEEAV